MAPILTCPDEHELLAVATGEPAVETIEQHLAGCPECRDRLERLRAELAALRRDLEGEVTSPSTEPDPAVNPDGKPSSDGTTLDWTSDPVETAAPEPLGPEAVAAARQRAEAPAERPGAIGRYLVVETLGSGSQGQVYRVIHPGLGQVMVLKLGRRPVSGDERVSLVKEGRLLKDLEHINLVKVYDLDFHNEQPFLVMEYVHGRNFEDYARDEPVTPRRAAELVAKLAEALALVHRRDVIHRDIKPRNILIDEAGEPRLIDFGLARLRHAWSDRPDPTWGGTLAYMAPEQARLEHDRIGPRSDVFGLGAVLYYLLTGQPPFVGENQDEVWIAPSVANSRRRPSASPRSRAGWADLPESPGRRPGRSLSLGRSLRKGTQALSHPAHCSGRAFVRVRPCGARAYGSQPRVALAGPHPFAKPPRGDSNRPAGRDCSKELGHGRGNTGRKRKESAPRIAADQRGSERPEWFSQAWHPDRVSKFRSAFLRVDPRLDGSSDGLEAPPSHPASLLQTPPAPALLAGELTVRVWSKDGGGKRGLKVDEPGALPLLAGEWVHLEAHLNQPAHAYLLWIEGQGHVSLLYPRNDGKFGSPPSDGSPRETVHSPEALDQGHKMTGPGGLETVLLLARRTPLPTGIDLAGLVGPLPPSPLRDEREFAKGGIDEDQPIEALRVALHRGIGDEPDKIDDPLLQLMEWLRKQGPFDVIKAVRFAYRGE